MEENKQAEHSRKVLNLIAQGHLKNARNSLRMAITSGKKSLSGNDIAEINKACEMINNKILLLKF